MILSEFVKELQRAEAEGGGDMPVLLVLPKSWVHLPVKVTRAYTSVQRQGTTFYDQVPAILIESETK